MMSLPQLTAKEKIGQYIKKYLVPFFSDVEPYWHLSFMCQIAQVLILGWW